jgi:adenylate cyclase
VQDEVVRAIASAIPGQLSHQALDHTRRKPPENLTAYEYELRGRWAYLHWIEGLPTAISWYEKAVALDPNYDSARSGLGLMYAYSVYVLGNDPERMFPLAREQIARAVAGDGKNPRVHQQAAMIYHLMGERDLALAHAERALDLNPNDPMVLQTMGEVLSYSGRMIEALDWYERSAKIEPYAPDDQRLDCICDTYFMLRQYDKVLQIHSTYQNVPPFLYGVLGATLAQLGRVEEARAVIKERFYGNLLPGQDPVQMAKTQLAMCSRSEDRQHWAEGYRIAGLLK